MNQKAIFKKIGAEKLTQYGYYYFVPFGETERKMYFFRKKLSEEIYTFIAYKQYMYVDATGSGFDLPRRFDISLWRNYGEIPRMGYDNNEKNMENWIYLSLQSLLWNELNLHIYEGPNHIWKFHDEAELIYELQNALNQVVDYGIPWLEDLNSKNPY